MWTKTDIQCEPIGRIAGIEKSCSSLCNQREIRKVKKKKKWSGSEQLKLNRHTLISTKQELPTGIPNSLRMLITLTFSSITCLSSVIQ